MARRTGFTLVELMIVISIIAVVSSIALPNLIASRMSANESAAIANLKQIVSSQLAFQISQTIDVDRDGVGEFGWLAEIAGSVPLRDAVGPLHGPVLNPPMLARSLGEIDTNGTVRRAGYVYRLSLPAAGGAGLLEAANGGSPTGEDPDLSELYWIAYAWPSGFASTGRRAFVVNQKGDIVQSSNAGSGTHASYSSLASVPTFDAAIEGGDAGDITGALAIGGIPSPAVDGDLWTTVN
jgi:prepilin-type N-terminal cleavage/methylation domain-containing protein